MQVIIKQNRRSFLKTSATAGGGLLLGFNFFSSCKTDPATQLIAEEIVREWSDINAFVKVATDGFVTIMSPNPEIGQGVKTSMPMVVAEELDVDWKHVIVQQAPLNTDFYSRQVAGGSQSIRRGWESLRTAGATARQMLVNAAAKQWDVDPAECTTEAGVVHHKNSGKSTNYGTLTTAAAEMEAPESVTLKDPKDFKIIGADVRNVDHPAIVTGKPLFGLDYRSEGMRYAAIIHPPAFGMTLGTVDDRAARSMPGIRDVVSFDNNVAIVAESTWQAMQAKEAVVVQWNAPEQIASSDEMDNAMDALLQQPTDEPKRSDGNLNGALRRASKVVEAVYECPFLPHSTLEPMNFFAHVTEDKAELYGPIQTPQRTRTSVAEALGMEQEQVSIMMSRMGGGFGRRLYGDFALEAAKISQLAKTPIQLVWTREDDMTAGMYRPACKYLFRAGVDGNGKMTAYHVRAAGINFSNFTRQNNFPAGTVEDYLVESHRIGSDVTTAAWRAPVTNFLACAEQSFIDEVAEAAGRDPVELRLELLQRAIENPVGELGYEPQRMVDVIDLVAEKSNWGSPSAGRHQGFSVYYSHNTYVAQVAEVEMDGNTPTVKKVFCAVDCGIVVNPLGARNQIEGGIIDGIGHAMYGELTITDGSADQKNFDTYRLIRMSEAPEVETHFINNGKDPTGLGEPTLPPVAGAVANAIYSATGMRLRKQPFYKSELLG